MQRSALVLLLLAVATHKFADGFSVTSAVQRNPVSSLASTAVAEPTVASTIETPTAAVPSAPAANAVLAKVTEAPTIPAHHIRSSSIMRAIHGSTPLAFNTGTWWDRAGQVMSFDLPVTTTGTFMSHSDYTRALSTPGNSFTSGLWWDKPSRPPFAVSYTTSSTFETFTDIQLARAMARYTYTNL